MNADLSGTMVSLVRAYGAELRAFLYTVLGDDDAADEVCAQAWENVWRALPRLAEPPSRGFAYKVAWNAALDFRKNAYRRRVRRLQTSEISHIAEEIKSSLSERLARSDRIERLRAALEPDEQALLTLRLDRELSWREIADILSTDEQPLGDALIRKRYERLKHKLRLLIDR
jgi:RNA polymerase sigma-70 factor (ECF subfamily)